MLKTSEKSILALRKILKDSDYLFVMKELRGASDFVNPWYAFEDMKRAMEKLDSPYRHTLELLQMGLDAERAQIAGEIGEEALEAILECGLWEEREGRIFCRNLVVLTYRGLYLVTELNPWYETCTNRNTDVYIGSDSLRLAENISWRRGARVLDLCSGTGIQGMMAARSAEHVVSVEINPKAVPVTRFNIRLNGMEDIMEVREGDLYDVLREGETFDCIYANPPFIPMLDTVEYPICGAGGEDGLRVLNRIMEGLPERLAPGGEVVIFCECLGDEKGVFYDRDVRRVCEENAWKCVASHQLRMIAGLQIEKLAELSALFSESFDSADFKKRMREIYVRLGASYLYNIVYRMENTGNFAFEAVDSFNPWHTADRAGIAPDLTRRQVGDFTCLGLGGQEKRMVLPDVAELVSTLGEGYTLEEAVKWLYYKYKATLIGKNVRFYGYLASVMETCRLLEQDGILERKTIH